MKKYVIVGMATFTLMATTVYALNDNNQKNVNEPIMYNQNCPYHSGNEDCPYYNQTTNSYNCSNNENCVHNNGHNNDRHGSCHRHHQ